MGMPKIEVWLDLAQWHTALLLDANPGIRPEFMKVRCSNRRTPGQKGNSN
jgi:hypothetical protein